MMTIVGCGIGVDVAGVDVGDGDSGENAYAGSSVAVVEESACVDGGRYGDRGAGCVCSIMEDGGVGGGGGEGLPNVMGPPSVLASDSSTTGSNLCEQNEIIEYFISKNIQRSARN
jgi:hypothetical protein